MIKRTKKLKSNHNQENIYITCRYSIPEKENRDPNSIYSVFPKKYIKEQERDFDKL